MQVIDGSTSDSDYTGMSLASRDESTRSEMLRLNDKGPRGDCLLLPNHTHVSDARRH